MASIESVGTSTDVVKDLGREAEGSGARPSKVSWFTHPNPSSLCIGN